MWLRCTLLTHNAALSSGEVCIELHSGDLVDVDDKSCNFYATSSNETDQTRVAKDDVLPELT